MSATKWGGWGGTAVDNATGIWIANLVGMALFSEWVGIESPAACIVAIFAPDGPDPALLADVRSLLTEARAEMHRGTATPDRGNALHVEILGRTAVAICNAATPALSA
jgi:hypothetical protein